MMFKAGALKGRGRRLGAWAAAGVMLAGTALGAEARKFEGHSDSVTGVAFFADPEHRLQRFVLALGH